MNNKRKTDPDAAEEPPAQARGSAAQEAEPAPPPAEPGADPEAPAAGEEPKTKAARKDKGHPHKTQDVQAVEDRLLRLQADFENFRKRTQREKDDLYRRANEDLVRELLPVLDHMEMVLETSKAHGGQEAILEGFRLVAGQLAAALGKFGLVPVDVTGGEFDVKMHEAVAHVPSADVPENQIIARARKGYRLGDRLLRPVQVVVSSGPPWPEGAEASLPPPTPGDARDGSDKPKV